MPLRQYLKGVTPEAARVMSDAYAGVCRRLDEAGQGDISTARVAAKVAEVAVQDSTDAKRLADKVFAALIPH